MNIDKLNFEFSSSNNYQNSDVAVVLSSYQPNRTSSDILRIALSSLEKINLKNVSVWVVDVGSPKNDHLVKKNEYKIN